MPDSPPQPAAPPPADASLFGSLAAWGGAALQAATSAATEAAASARSLLGLEGLAVIDPTGSGSTTGADSADDHARATAFADWAQYVGRDISDLVALPIWISEPTTNLQRVAEIMEGVPSLVVAAGEEDEFMRMAHVASFCLAPFGGNERTMKPFNPLLGETFQLDLETDGTDGDGEDGSSRRITGRFLAEQVSHHPPIAAARAEGPGWAYDIVSAPKTKFLGNAVDIFPLGRTRISLPGRGETYSLSPPNSKAHNLIVGRTWVDCHGELRLSNLATGAECALTFTPCGWFGAGRYEVGGHIADGKGVKRLALSGAWNSHLDAIPCDPETGEALPAADPTRVWACPPKPTPADKWALTHFARRLCEGTGVDPLPSDSRRRPDRAALEAGDQRAAGAHRHALEEAQRAEKKRREKDGHGHGEAWAPRWFTPIDAEAAKAAGSLHANDADPAACPVFEFKGDLAAAFSKSTGGAGGGGGGESGAPSCSGRGFNPWQFPDLHAEVLLGDYEAGPATAATTTAAAE